MNDKSTSFTAGNVVLIGMLIVCSASAIKLIQYATQHRTPVIGDGQNVETYGFDLSNSRIDTEDIVAGGMAKNSLLSMDDPELWTPEDVDLYNEEIRGKYLVSSDLVIGVEINGESRAYPLRVLSWHEVVNDTLGGVPIAVTYNYLSDCAVVFDRRVDGDTIKLGFSGLLYQSNSLYYDKQVDATEESLWSQMLAQAVTGPAAEAGKSLDVIPGQRVTWNRWITEHPDTRVIKPIEDQIKRYQSNAGGAYFGSDLLLYPVEPLPPQDSYDKKTPTVVFIQDGEYTAIPIPEIVSEDESVNSLYVEKQVFGESVGFEYTRVPESVYIRTDSDSIRYFHTFWFAWYAFKDTLNS